MAKIVGIIYTSHGGYTTVGSEHWVERRARRSYRPDMPEESQEEMDEKWARTNAGKAFLRDKLAEFKPDVLVIFGDDQEECFDFNNFPALAVYLGAEMSGKQSDGLPHETRTGPPPFKTAPGHPGLATSIVLGLLDRGFDPAFMVDLPRPDRGMSHAIMVPLGFYTEFDIPTVPILVNAYYAPQVTAKRCYEIGKTVRELIESYPEDLRVVVVGSGGLWHTPAQERSWLNVEFDTTGLKFLETGDAKAWATHFDSYQVSPDDPSQDHTVVRRGVTGLPTLGGPQGGTRETLCWICAAGVGEGRPAVIVDYVPIYASPVGNAFAYCDDV